MKSINKLKHILSSVLGILALATFSISTTLFAATEEHRSAPQEEPSVKQSSVIKYLGVSRYWSSSLSNLDADYILNSGSIVLQQYDGPGDVNCPLNMHRYGGVQTFYVGDGSIDSGRDFSNVLNTPGFVKVVNRINYCGGFSPNIIGCAPVPGNGLVVIRFRGNAEGILWAHEYGHTRGLHHWNYSTAVMNATLNGNRRRVTSSECSYFLN